MSQQLPCPRRAGRLALPSALSTALSIALVCGVMYAQQTPVPTSYNANTTRNIIHEPTLPALGAAGFRFFDPAFGSRVLRVTDASTHPDYPGASWVTGSAAHQLAWNATSDKFWVRSVMGAYVAFNFNGSTMTATRITTTTPGDGGLIFSQLEPQFSFVSPNVLYGTRQGGSPARPIVRRFDFSTLTYTDILDLGDITAISGTTYARALAGSKAAPEKLSVLFGGSQPSRDQDYKVAVFQVGSPSSTWKVLDTQALTITRADKTMTSVAAMMPQLLLHHQWIDLTGRYVLLYPINGSFAPPMPYFIWDTNNDAITRVDKFPGGHDALGYGWQVNQDCCTTSDYDGAQWQLRTLANPTATTDLINPVLTPEVLLLGEHTSWNNAQPTTLVPILSSLYRYGSPQPPWRAWDGEIIAIQTNASPAGATVWRFAHHRTDITYDGGDGSQPYYFWYLPRAMISPDGRFAMFTSNWEKTLGPTTGADVEPGGNFRNDVFIVALVNTAAFTDDPLVAGVTLVKAVHITELRARIDALRIRFGLAAYAWTDATLAAGTTIKAVHLTQLREALEQAYTAAKQSPPTYTDPVITAQSTVIRAAHIQQLRTAVLNLEAS